MHKTLIQPQNIVPEEPNLPDRIPDLSQKNELKITSPAEISHDKINEDKNSGHHSEVLVDNKYSNDTQQNQQIADQHQEMNHKNQEILDLNEDDDETLKNSVVSSVDLFDGNESDREKINPLFELKKEEMKITSNTDH